MTSTQLLLDVALKAALVLAGAGVAALVLRRSSAARRHAVWTAGAVGALVIPLLAVALPGWAVLPSWTRPEVAQGASIASPASAPSVAESSTASPSERSAPLEETAAESPSGVAGPVTPAADPREPWGWVLSLWIAGAAVTALPLLLGFRSLWRLERRARPVTRGPLLEQASRCATELGIERSLLILESDQRSMPMHWGLMRQRLLLPSGAVDWPRARLRSVLLHELAHVRRRDCLTQLAAELTRVLYWFNPLAWLARARMRVEREVACDDLVLGAGQAPVDYAEELLRVARGHRTPPLAGPVAIPMARPSTLERRLRAILDDGRDRHLVGRRQALAALALLACALPPLAMAEGRLALQDPPTAGEHSFEVTLVGADGEPIPSSTVTFWKACEGRESDALPPWEVAVKRGWFDRRTGTHWEAVHHFATSDRATIADLTPGTYRATAGLSHGTPTQFADSGPVTLEGVERHTQVALVMEAGPSLTINLVDAASREPVEYVELFILRSDGLPLASWSSGWSLRPREGRYAFEHLAPGRYTLHARLVSTYSGHPDWRLEGGPREIELIEGSDLEVALPMRAVEPSEEEAARRWPWAVTGQVTSDDGQPLSGVKLIAHTGWGTLRPTGEAWTDEQGRYLLRFGPGMWSRDEETGEWRVGMQAATISPWKSGWFERNLHRQGDLRMASTRPPAEEAGEEDFDRLVLPDEPRRLDFVMRRGATLNGILRDAAGNPIAGGAVSLDAHELWPSSSVLHWERTDGEGRFTLDPVPVDLELWFEHDRVESTPFTVIGAAALEVELRFVRDEEGGARLEVEGTAPR